MKVELFNLLLLQQNIERAERKSTYEEKKKKMGLCTLNPIDSACCLWWILGMEILRPARMAR